MNIIKKTFAIFISIFTLAALLTTSYATNECHWYIKRNGNLRPDFPDEADEVKKHGGYFINERLTDNSSEKRLYLTFDAGYENGNIEKILDVLKKENVTAAFFLLDNIIKKNTNLVKRMADEGHLVCNHTRNHKNLSNATETEIAENISSLEKIYEEKTGRALSKYFRFPEGKYSIKSLECIEKLGYKTIFWSFAYDDWDDSRQPNFEQAIKKILDNTHNGAVILLHPTSRTNAEILPTLISEWRKMGYSFGTLDELTN